MPYDKMKDYIESVFNVFLVINKKAEQQQDRKFKMIALTIYNYALNQAKENEIDLKEFSLSTTINLIPIFEYVAYNNIQLYDFSNINMNDVDVRKKQDLERFVLTHIYYITQNKLV